MLKILTVAIFLTSCSTYQVVPLPLPERPVFPKIQPVEVQCLTDQTYEKLRKWDILWEIHANKLEGIIKSTRE